MAMKKDKVVENTNEQKKEKIEETKIKKKTEKKEDNEIKKVEKKEEINKEKKEKLKEENEKVKKEEEFEEKEDENVEITMKIDKNLYNIYKVFFEEFKKENENKILTEKELHWKIFMYMFYNEFLNKNF